MKVVAILLLSLVSFSASAQNLSQKAILLRAFEKAENKKCTVTDILNDDLSDYEINCSSPQVSTTYSIKIFDQDILGAGYAWTNQPLRGGYCTVDGYVSVRNQQAQVSIFCQKVQE